MHRVTHVLTKPDEWYRVLNEQIPSTFEGNKFQLDSSFGEGGLKYKMIQEGLWVHEMNFKLNEDLHIHREKTPTNHCFIVNMYLSQSSIRQKTKDKYYDLNFDEVNMLLNSSCAEFEMEVPKGVDFQNFSIGFTKEWFDAYLRKEDNDIIDQLFNDTNSLYLSEKLNYKHREIISKLSIDENTNLHIFANILNILDYFFDEVKKREEATHSQIHYMDLEHLIASRIIIDNNLDKPFTVEALAEKTGMSLSKYKRLFKQVFGVSPYKYHLKNKMERAMDLLSENKYSISEVGFLVGYSNISQFTKAFKKHFDFLPSKVNRLRS